MQKEIVDEWIENYKLIMKKDILYFDNINKGIGYKLDKQLALRCIKTNEIIINIYDITDDLWTSKELEDLAYSLISIIRERINFEVDSCFDIIGKRNNIIIDESFCYNCKELDKNITRLLRELELKDREIELLKIKNERNALKDKEIELLKYKIKLLENNKS